MNAATEAAKFAFPQLNENEIYTGAIIAPDGTGHHVILLDGDNDDADWQTQMDWAKSIGGDLPNRVEQALLYAHLKDRFQPKWYWSNTQHASLSDYAWDPVLLRWLPVRPPQVVRGPSPCRPQSSHLVIHQFSH